MADWEHKGENSAIHEVEKKTRLSISVIAFVITTLFFINIYHLFPSVSRFLFFIPDISINVIVVISFFLALIGLFLAVRISRQIFRIILDYSNKLERLLGITSDLREELYGDILLEKILDHALAITNADAGSILLCEGDKLVFKIVKGEKALQLIGKSVDRGKGISGWVAENKQAIRIMDVSKDKRFNSDIDRITGYETKSILCMPLIARSVVIGIIELLNRRDGHPFRQRDEEVIAYLAGQAAISILKTQFVEDQKNYEIHLTEIVLEAMDLLTAEKQGHAKRVARYSNVIAKGLNMSEEQKKRVYYASLLHDIGFMKINTEESFRREEFERHPSIGYEMIKPITVYADLAPIILHHHERFDGQGYPARLAGEEIPLEARILAIAEAFDAMVSSKSYKVPVSFNNALLELKRTAGSQFDPALVEIFTCNIRPQHVQE